MFRSDGSGTTAQFTAWLNNQYPSIWKPFNNGRSGLTSYWPRKGNQVAASGSDQVMNTLAAATGVGAIAYVEYSYPVNKGYPVVKVLNRAGFYVEPTQYAVAVALTKAKINPGQELQAVPDAGPRRRLHQTRTRGRTRSRRTATCSSPPAPTTPG